MDDKLPRSWGSIPLWERNERISGHQYLKKPRDILSVTHLVLYSPNAIHKATDIHQSFSMSIQYGLTDGYQCLGLEASGQDALLT